VLKTGSLPKVKKVIYLKRMPCISWLEWRLGDS